MYGYYKGVDLEERWFDHMTPRQLSLQLLQLSLTLNNKCSSKLEQRVAVVSHYNIHDVTRRPKKYNSVRIQLVVRSLLCPHSRAYDEQRGALDTYYLY